MADLLGQSNGLPAASHWTAPSISDRNCPRDSRLIVLGRTFPIVCFLRMLNLKSASSDQPIGSFEVRPFLLASSSDSSLKFSRFYWLCSCIHNRGDWRCTEGFASQKYLNPGASPSLLLPTCISQTYLNPPPFPSTSSFLIFFFNFLSFASLSPFLSSLPPITTLRSSCLPKTSAQVPDCQTPLKNQNRHGLQSDQLAVCSCK